MVKHLASKRTDKSLTVESFWEIRESLKTKIHVSKVINPHIEDKVRQQFRYQRQKNLVRQFNPLAVLLQDRITPEDTHTQLLLQNLTNLPKPINRVRSMCLTLPLLLHNLPLIVKLLTDNLQIQDSWKLLEAVLRDTGIEAFEVFLQSLGKLVKDVGQGFDNVLFKRIFAVLSLYLENSYERIREELKKVWSVLRTVLFEHDNKYVRRFSVECFSYVLGRLPKEELYEFYETVISDAAENTDRIGWAMFHELRPVGGYLTHISAERFGQLWDHLFEIILSIQAEDEMEVEQQNGDAQVPLRSRYLQSISSLLQHMCDRLTIQPNQTSDMMLDLCDMLRIVTEKSLKMLKRSNNVGDLQPVLNCIDHTLTTNKYARNNQNIMECLAKLFKETLKLKFQRGSEQVQFCRLMGVFLSAGKQQPSKDKYFEYLKSVPTQSRVAFMTALIEESERQGCKYKLREDLTALLVLVLQPEISEFLNAETKDEACDDGLSGTLYRLCLVLKFSDFNKKLDLEKLSVTLLTILRKLESWTAAFKSNNFRKLDHLLTLLKLLKHVQLEAASVSSVKHTFDQLNSHLNAVLDELFRVELNQDDEGKLFDLNYFLKQLCAHNSHLLPAVDFILNFKEFAQEFAGSHSILFQTDESRFHWLYNSRENLLSSSVLDPKLLSSRVRRVRYHHMQAVDAPCELVSVLLAIDQEEVDLQTEREVKRLLSTIAIKSLSEDQASILVWWCMGFCYTGFKLVEQTLVNVLSELLATHQHITCKVVLEELQYMNMKMSRKFSEALSKYLQSSMQPIDQFCSQDRQLMQLLREEYPPASHQTAESIGFQRVATALQQSTAGRSYLKSDLEELLTAYFTFEFRRSQRLLERLSQPEEYVMQAQLQGRLLPPHPLHLTLIMKILPDGYLPPYEVLHYDSSFISTFEKLGIKTMPWQTIWQKKTDEQTHYDVNGKLSKEEQRLYQHFLWKLVLEGDEHKRQKVFEYLRSELPQQETEYLLNLCLSQIYLKLSDITPSISREAIRRLEMLGEKQLTAFLRTMSSLLEILKLTVKQWVPILAQLLVFLNQQVEDRPESPSTKLLRRTCGKTLVTLYREFSMFPELIRPSAEILLEQLVANIRKLQSGSISAVPTLLRVLLEWSNIPELTSLFQREHLLVGISKIYNQTSKKQALEILNELLTNLYGATGDAQLQPGTLDTLRQVSSQLLDNFVVYFETQAVPNLKIIALLKHIIPFAEVIPEGISRHTIATITGLLGKSRKNQEKFKENIVGLLELMVGVTAKAPLSAESYSEVMQLIPQVETDLKQPIIDILEADPKALNKDVHQLARGLNSTIQTGLDILPDYTRILGSLKKIGERLPYFTNLEREYILLNLITMVANEELAAKATAVEKIEQWLAMLTLEDLPQFKLLYRIVLQMLKIHSRDEQKFFACVAVAGLFLQCLQRLGFTGISERDTIHNKLGLCEARSERNFFKLITSIVQNEKLRAVNLLKANLEKLREHELKVSDEIRHDLPSTLTRLILPLLEQLITSKSKGKLSSSLSLACIKLEGQLFALLTPSEMKQELKRLAMRLDFKDTHSKNNVLIMKLLNEILDNVEIGKSVLPALQEQIRNTGVEVLNHQRENFQLDEDVEDDEEELEQVNQKYIRLDRKLIAAEEETETIDPLVGFLRKCLLVPLKSMLFYQSRGGADESKEATSRLFLTVVLTKLLMRFPLPVFLIEFNKIVNKLSRMLKKKSKQVRDNARKCLSQIVKLTGAPLLHTVIRELAFHLNQNFEKHIFTYSVHSIINELADQPRVLDYCLPLVLPCCYEDIFGQSSAEKELADDNEIPTTIFEVKKRKGFELLMLVSKLISPDKIDQLITSLKNELKKQLISEQRLTKFQNVIGSVVAGLSKNEGITNPEHILPLLDKFIKESSEKLRLFELNESLNDSTVKSDLKKQRAVTKEQVLTLQPQTGRGGSIFRKVNRQIMVKRNVDQFASCLSNLHLSLVLMTLKRGLLTEQISLGYSQQVARLVEFVVSCLEHNSNIVLGKALRITAELLKWSSASLVVSHREAIAKKVLKNLDRLTSGQKQLARECFTVVTLVVKEIVLPFKYVGPLLSHIRLHMEEDTRECYELLKTLLLKHTKHPDLLPVLEQVRQNMISTYRDDIRKASKSVYGCYLRQCHAQKQKDMELMFLIKNADYAEMDGRLAVLESLEELLKNFSREELEHYAEILFMSLLAAYSIEQESSLKQKFESIEHSLLKSVNKAKVGMILEQGLCWAKEQDKAIRLNGLNTFLLSQGLFQLTSTHIQQLTPIVKQEAIQAASQLDNYFTDVKERANQQIRLRNESSWNNIISTMVEEPKIVDRPICLVASLLLAQKLPALHKDDEYLEAICSLCCHPCKEQHISATNLVQVLAATHVAAIAKHLTLHLRDFTEALTELKLHQSQRFVVHMIYLARDNFQEEFVQELLVMLRRAVHHAVVTPNAIQKKVNKNEKTLEYLSHLLLKLLEDPQSSNLLANPSWRTVVVQTASKLANQKQAIPEPSYEEVEKFLEALKQVITPQVYYELTSELKAARLEKTKANKAAYQQLAIIDHEQYQQEKMAGNKKVKRARS